MMITYQLRFTRYCPKKAERRLSGVMHVEAENFAAAVQRANDVVAGMVGCDPDREYAVMSVSTDAYHGVDCLGAGYMIWETPEEFSARVAAKAEARA